MPAVAAKLAEGGGKLDAGEQIIGEGFGRKDLRTDRRSPEAELLEHARLEGFVTTAGRDAETDLGVVDADGAADFSHQLFRGTVGTLDIGENPAEDRCEPEADRDGQRVLPMGSADLRLTREQMDLLDEETNHPVGEPPYHVVSAHEL